MDAAFGSTGEQPDQPGVDVAEDHLALLRPGLDARDVVEDPFDLRSREVGGQRKAHLGTKAVLPTLAAELLDDLVGASVLPDDRVVDRLACLAVPHHRGLALVGDADGRDVLSVYLREGALYDPLGPLPDLHRVVLYPTWLRIDLLMFLLRDGDDLAAVVEDHEASARGPLVDRRRVLCVRHLNSFR